MRAEVDVRPVRERRRPRAPQRRSLLRSVAWRTVLVWGSGLLAFAILAVGVVFAGSSSNLAAGVRVGGVNVAGKSVPEAAESLERQAAEAAKVPVGFTAGGKRFPLRPRDLDARVDWNAAAVEAQTAGNWPMPFRGLRRVYVRLFGADVAPTADVYEPRLAYELDRIAGRVDRPGRDAAIVLHGLEPSIVRHEDGRTLERRAAADVIVAALASFERRPVELPVKIGPPAVTAEELEPVLAQVETALSRPVRFGWKDAHWLVQPREMASLLQLPANGRDRLRIAGPGAERYFAVLARAVNRRPKEASFAIGASERVRVVPSASGRRLDVDATARALLAAALSRNRREAELVVAPVQPRITTKVARAMKVTNVLASYTTAYAGTYDRIQNLRRATALIDGTTVAPGQTFSFNRVVGPRTAKRGFREAPTIVDGEYKDELGGGVSQVATTVFNAAWEAGVKITDRTAHSLYINRYPAGRDATVVYPDIDLRLENDTDNWLVVRGQATDAGITITLLGAPANRRVVTEAGPLRVTGPPEIESHPDPTLLVGEEVVVDAGEPSRAIAVKRIVYEGGKVLYDETWYTTYQSEPRIVRMGTIPVPEEEEPAAAAPDPAAPPSSEPTRPPPPQPPVGTTTAPTTTAPAPSAPSGP
jgi:vancomycin resistance protein YoaR